MPAHYKVVVFDLDETLGYFLELGKFWELCCYYVKTNTSNENVLSQTTFNQLLDLFPEFVRPRMLPILNYLKYKKIKGECTHVMIYTNNQNPKSWATMLINYFHEKIHYVLFDQIIAAFKVNGKQIEPCRTTQEKTFDDFIRCTKLPTNTKICFLDDVYHPDMTGDNIYYIKVNPYIYNLSFDKMLHRFLLSDLRNVLLGDDIADTQNFYNIANTFLKKFIYVYSEKSKEEYEIDKIVSKKTMILLQEFFKIKQTRKKYHVYNNNNKYNDTHNKTLKK